MPRVRLSDRIRWFRRRRRPYFVERGPSTGWHVFDRHGHPTSGMTEGNGPAVKDRCEALAAELNGGPDA